ncbi:MAG: DUF6062 family protein, partial [Clostridia bacterium]|nr:DUF6062 family protein [Clostridia bacterium]
MVYHIDTGLIHDELAGGSECPVCAIRRKVEEQFLTEYLNDAVTDDDARMQVNEFGFCADHYKKLFLRPNKLSLALQNVTRLSEIRKKAGKPTDVRSAVKTGDSVKKLHTCVICNELDSAMTRYYIGIAELYLKDSGFKDELLNTKGFCIDHYGKLLEYAKYAGAKSKEYIAVLNETENKALDRLTAELKWFCDKHDYRNRLKPMGTSQDVLPRLYEKLYGKK